MLLIHNRLDMCFCTSGHVRNYSVRCQICCRPLRSVACATPFAEQSSATSDGDLDDSLTFSYGRNDSEPTPDVDEMRRNEKHNLNTAFDAVRTRPCQGVGQEGRAATAFVGRYEVLLVRDYHRGAIGGVTGPGLPSWGDMRCYWSGITILGR